MTVPNRNYQSLEYRYGFQGQEKDDEVKGSGNSLNYRYRMHDPRIGRFFATDPLEDKYPFFSPYQFSANTPIMAVELEGLESSNDPNLNQSPTGNLPIPYGDESSAGSGSNVGTDNNLPSTELYGKIDKELKGRYESSQGMQRQENGKTYIYNLVSPNTFTKTEVVGGKEMTPEYGFILPKNLGDWNTDGSDGLRWVGCMACHADNGAYRYAAYNSQENLQGQAGAFLLNLYGPSFLLKSSKFTAAQRLANKARSLPSNIRPNTVAVIETVDGKIIIGRNQGGVINKITKSDMIEVGINNFEGQCAEMNALSRARNKGVNLEGAKISVANVRGVKSTTGIHATSKTPCSTCNGVLKKNNIKVKN